MNQTNKNAKKHIRNRIKKVNSIRGGNITYKKLITAVIVVLLTAAFITGFTFLYLYITESEEDPYNPYPVVGVDVSSYQKDIDWKGLEDEGIEFAFIKATEGTTYIDGRFEYNWKEANKTGMKVGAYHFLTYTSAGETQAENFINTVGHKWRMMPPVVDVEFYGNYLDNPPSKDEMYEILDPLLRILEEEYDRVPIIYTNINIYKKYLSKIYERYPVWISSPDGIPDKLDDGKEWLFCQYTFTGTSPSVAGGTEYIDYNVFNGTKWDFRRYNGK